jgi:hypothetical protein
MADIQVDHIAQIAREEFESLCAAFPEQREPGCTLFLGRFYAQEDLRVVMLGLNPGGEDSGLETNQQTGNCLLDDFPTKEPYWRNARFLFAQNGSGLRQAMETATYSFVCPFRTRSWPGSGALLEALKQHSRPILLQLLRDCRPRLVIIAGVAGLRLFRELLQHDAMLEQFPFTRSANTKRTYQWQAIRMSMGDRPCIVAQIPHLSRANSKERLTECRRWLDNEVLPSAQKLP